MSNPFEGLRRTLSIGGQEYSYFSLPDLQDARLAKLPFCVRVLLESAIRCCDGEKIHKRDVENILGWEQLHRSGETEIQWKPARVILQDFTGVPCVVDLAAMRDVTKRLGGDPARINPGVPVDLVIDHSVQVDKFRSKDALEANLQLEMQRNKERFVFLKWGAKAFDGLTIVPPGAGIVHQVNLEYISRVVFNNNGLLYPDSLVGTDSHTPMVNGLGVVGWGVGGIEAEAVMLAQPISMVLPEVIGYKLTGTLPAHATATDLILAITKELRKKGVVEKFVEFFGPGVAQLSIADRATISNMSPETGATICFFPVDDKALEYMRLTGRSNDCVAWTEGYLKAQGLFRDYNDATQDPQYSSILELDLSTIVPCVAGPKRPHDYVALTSAKADFLKCLENPVGHKGFAISETDRSKSGTFKYDGKEFTLKHGDVVLAAITSCTNTSNPNVLIGAGLLAKKAVEKGLRVEPYIKTSLAPGSGVVTQYLERSGLLPYLEQLGFNVVGYGCTTCIGNSGPLPEEVAQTIEGNDLVAVGVLSGNRNFEGRIHPNVRANYLASPPLVVAYALAKTFAIDFDSEPIGRDQSGQPVFLRDIWPSQEEISTVVQACVLKEMFLETYQKVTQGTTSWNALDAPSDKLYAWDPVSTYIHNPPYFQSMTRELNPITKVEGAFCLLNLGDSITTDHISPAGSIAKNSPAARYLEDRGVSRDDWNSYGARRGNDEVMARGTFANIRLVNKLMGGKPGPKTVHIPTGEVLDIYDASSRYIQANAPLVILAGEQYGSGSSRDWAAKGTWMLGVKAVFAQSYERIHRSNLVLFGVVPFQFREGESADKLGLTGKETFSFDLGNTIIPGSEITVKVNGSDSVKEFQAILRFDTETEVTYYRNGGVLNYVVREQISKSC